MARRQQLPPAPLVPRRSGRALVARVLPGLLRCLLLLALASAAGCKLLALGVACEIDDNCKDGERCSAGLCVRQGEVVEENDAGRPLEDAGPQLPDCPLPEDDPDARLVLTEPLVITSAAQLAELAGVVVVEGDLSIGGGADLGAVDLPELVEVTGTLRLDQLDDVTPPGFTAALVCLSRVGGGLVIDGSVVSAFSLPRLEEVNGPLTLEDGLPGLSLPKLTRVGAQLTLEQLAITDASGLAALRDLGGLLVNDNPELVSLAGLDAIRELRASLLVRNNPQLATLAPLDDVSGVGGVLQVTDNAALPECEAEALRDALVANGFRDVALVSHNDEDASCAWLAAEPCPPVLGPVECPADAPSLTLASDADVAAAAAVTCAGDLLIAPGVTSACLPALAEVSGSLTLGDGNTATRVDLPALRTVGSLYGSGPVLTALELPRLETASALELFGLPVLERLYLPRLDSVGGSFRVRDAAAPLLYLPQLDDIVGELELIRLTSSAALDLPYLADVDGVLRVRETGALTSLGGLPSLLDVGGLDIALNVALADFDGMALENVFADIVIDQNPLLHSIDGIDATLAFSGNLVTVTNNACLPQAEAQAWAETLSPGANVVANNGVNVCD